MVQHYWNLTIWLFSVISRPIVGGGGVLPLSREAIGVFYRPNQLGKPVGRNRFKPFVRKLVGSKTTLTGIGTKLSKAFSIQITVSPLTIYIYISYQQHQDVSLMHRPTQNEEDFYNQLYTRKITSTWISSAFVHPNIFLDYISLCLEAYIRILGFFKAYILI